MFLYQMRDAIRKMQKIPMMLSTDSLDIEDVNPPLLTLCPLKQYNVSKVCHFFILNGQVG